MSLEMLIKESETGLIRLFSIELPSEEALALKDEPGGIAALLGLDAIESSHMEVFDIADLEGMGLATYLAEGHGISDEDLSPMAARLEELDGVLMILRSAAIEARPATLRPRAPLHWVATFGEDRPPVPLAGIDTPSARGTLSGPADPKSAPRGSLTVILLSAVILLSFIAVLWLAFGRAS